MKSIYIPVFCVILVIGLLFFLNNLNPVSINFYYTHVDIPLALTLEFAAGVVLGLLVGTSRNIKIKSECQKLDKQLALAEQELENLRTSIPGHQLG